ncbi:MAG: hypothetical protein ABI652_08835, partial [Acidobacteriota bacterium]
TTQHEPAARVPHMVGVYNCTWSAAAAFAYFTGGALYDWLGTGAVFWVPCALFVALLLHTSRIARQAAGVEVPEVAAVTAPAVTLPVVSAKASVSPATFLKLAWLANPFSYVAVYTLLAVMPGIAARLGLSPARAGLFCSVWLFGRLAAFVVLWKWTGWHYRFAWLACGYMLLAGSFVAILLAPTLWVIVAAQGIFGVSCGLMYYSSLFYSLDVGEAKAEHSGLHEAAIGAGIFAGPAVGALSLYAFPGRPDVSAGAVSGLLVVGFVAMVALWTRGRAAAMR